MRCELAYILSPLGICVSEKKILIIFACGMTQWLVVAMIMKLRLNNKINILYHELNVEFKICADTSMYESLINLLDIYLLQYERMQQYYNTYFVQYSLLHVPIHVVIRVIMHIPCPIWLLWLLIQLIFNSLNFLSGKC